MLAASNIMPAPPLPESRYRAVGCTRPAWAAGVRKQPGRRSQRFPLLHAAAGRSLTDDGWQTPALPHADSYLPRTPLAVYVHRAPLSTSLRCFTISAGSSTARET